MHALSAMSLCVEFESEQRFTSVFDIPTVFFNHLRMGDSSFSVEDFGEISKELESRVNPV